MNDDDRQRWSGDRNPANRDECSQADPAEAGGGLVRGDEAGVAHRMISSRRLSGIDQLPLAMRGSDAKPHAGRASCDEAYKEDDRASCQSRQSRQALSDRRRGGRDQLYRRARRHGGIARRQRRRQDDNPVGNSPASSADRRQGAGARRGHAAPSLPRAAANEFFLALCRPAAPADGTPESADLRPPLWSLAAAQPYREPRRRSADLTPSRSPV